jgi:hypothetical protein
MTQEVFQTVSGAVLSRVLLLAFALTVMSALPVCAQPAAGDDLSVEQARLADRFDRLEQVVGRLAELSASTDPRRARLLREAIARSREQDINVRFESIVKLLEDERLSAANDNQSDLQKELDSLLVLLLKADRDEQIASERERIRKYLKEVGRLIRMQKGIRARTEEGDEAGSLAKDQQQLADDTGKLGGSIDENERDEPPGDEPIAEKDGEEEPSADESSESGEKPKDGKQSKSGESEKSGKSSDGEKSDSSESPPSDSAPSDSKPSKGKPSGGQPSEPSDSPPSDSQPAPGQPSQSPGSPPSSGPSEGEPPESDAEQQPQQPADRATERLRTAQQRMEDAKKKLDEAERDGAAQKQREALKELELAKAELERVLRQLREEEMERTLTQLAARFRKMLAAQVAVYEGTGRLDQVPEASRDHDDEIEAAKLSRDETLIVREADKAMLLLREEGSSVAFPEAVKQMRDDMQQVAERLAALKVGAITQGLEEDIIAALEETIAALEKAIKDLEKKRTPPGQAPAAGQMAEPPLVDKLAELKMIRSLQMRINRRTERYGKMIGGEQAETPELIEALEDLSGRQRRVYQATYDLSQGSND